MLLGSADAIGWLGGSVVGTLDDCHPTIIIGHVEGEVVGRVRIHPTWNGWAAGVVTGDEARLAEAIEFPVAGVLAGGLGVAEAFGHVRGSVTAGRRDVGLSLWQTDASWRDAHAVGPTLEYLPMNAPEAEQQLVSGVYALEDNRFRWTAGQAVILLKSPAVATPLRVVFVIHGASPARRISLLLDGKEVAAQTYTKPDAYTLEAPAQRPSNATATLTIVVDKTFSVAGDGRELGIVLSEAGFR